MAVIGAVLEASLWIAAVGTGVMAGVYFAFSTFIMKALGAIPRSEGVAAMQSINEVIVSSPFMPLFLVTTLAAVGLAGSSLFRWGETGALAVLVGGSIYFIGMFACTAAFNVPLNDALAAVAPTGEEAGGLWSDYLRRWTMWNHVRTAASVCACALFISSLAGRG